MDTYLLLNPSGDKFALTTCKSFETIAARVNVERDKVMRDDKRARFFILRKPQ